MTKEELQKEIQKIEKSNECPISYLDDEKYKELFIRYCAMDKAEFIFSEAIQIYLNTDNDMLKVKILELLLKNDY